MRFLSVAKNKDYFSIVFDILISIEAYNKNSIHWQSPEWPEIQL